MRSTLVILALVVGCGNKGAATDDRVASCNQPSIHGCREYRGDNLALGSDSIAKLCSAVAPGDFKGVACPTTDVIGSCAKPEGKDFYYTGYPVEIAEVERLCKELGGTFATK